MQILKKTEKLNEFGIISDSILNLTLFGAFNLNYENVKYKGNLFNPYCVIQCGETKIISSISNGINPLWNELYEMYHI